MSDDDPRTVTDAHDCVPDFRVVLHADHRIDPLTGNNIDRYGDVVRDCPFCDDPRTVFDVLGMAVHELPIDPDMPYDQFRRRLEMGERAEKTHEISDQPNSEKLGSRFCTGWDMCLTHIRGGPGA